MIQNNNFYYYPYEYYAFYQNFFPYQNWSAINFQTSQCTLPFQSQALKMIETAQDQTGTQPREQAEPIQSKPHSQQNTHLHLLRQNSQIKPSENTVENQPNPPIYQSRQKAIQKENRNSVSNLLRMFFRKVEVKVKHSPQYLTAIIEKHNLNITAKQFGNWLLSWKIDFRNYIRITSIQKIFKLGEEGGQFSKLLRVLLWHFSKQEGVNCLLTSKRVSYQSKLINLRVLRSFTQQILSNSKQFN